MVIMLDCTQKIKLLKSFFVQPEIYYSSINRKYDLTFPADHEKYIVDEYRQNRIIIPVFSWYGFV